jgi:outer membrane protein, heavy metal efflux system
MFKYILISGFICTFLGAESFDIFLQKAIQNSPYLESSALAVQQTKEEGDILTRYENPTLELEYSSFKPDIGSSDEGYRVNYSQPIRLWNVADDKRAVASSNIKSANASLAQKRAIFIRDMSISFTLYSQAKMLLVLGDEELQIAKKIYDISVARLQSGTISKGLKLQAQVDFEMSENSKDFLSLNSMQSYYSLLKFAGVNEEIELDSVYDFTISADVQNINNPELEVFKAQQNQAFREAKLNSNSVEWINLFTELENEPEQDIVRVGLNFPLAIFNDKSQEKRVATLQVSRTELLIKNENSRLNIELKKLQKERQSLFRLSENSEKILSTQLELLKMYEDGYEISNINLLQLQDIKNRVIETKRTLIQIHTALNQNAIYTNYTQGSYNE